MTSSLAGRSGDHSHVRRRLCAVPEPHGGARNTRSSLGTWASTPSRGTRSRLTRCRHSNANVRKSLSNFRTRRSSRGSSFSASRVSSRASCTTKRSRRSRRCCSSAGFTRWCFIWSPRSRVTCTTLRGTAMSSELWRGVGGPSPKTTWPNTPVGVSSSAHRPTEHQNIAGRNPAFAPHAPRFEPTLRAREIALAVKEYDRWRTRRSEH
jgi:hypothetical protein